MPKIRMRLEIVGEYDADVTEEAYGTLDPFEAAKIDQAGATHVPHEALEWLDMATFKVSVEPVSENGEYCPANHGEQCCGYPLECMAAGDPPEEMYQ